VWASFVGIWESTEFRQYLRRRGYRSSSGWPLFRRAFLECWAQPGFHWFWRVWSPSLGFLVFRLYRALGGNRAGGHTKVLAFVTSGITHSLLVLPFLGWSFTIPTAFAGFGLLVVLGPFMSRRLRQHRWPLLANVAVNVALILGCFWLGFRVDEQLRGKCCCPGEHGPGNVVRSPSGTGVTRSDP